MKRKGITTIILILLSFSFIFSSTCPELMIVTAQESSDKSEIRAANYNTSLDYSWTPISIAALGDEATLNDITYDDYFEYTINEKMIYIHELDTYDCYYGVYATLPVIDGKVTFSVEIRCKSGHVDGKNTIIRWFDPITKTRIWNHPLIASRNDGVTLESDFDYVGGSFDFEGYDEVIIFINIRDAHVTDWGTEAWYKNFRVYEDEQLPLKQTLHRPIPLTEYNWTFGTYLRLPYGDLIPNSAGEFTYEVNSTHLVIEESGSGTYNAYVGASTIIPVNENYISLAFEGKASDFISDEANIHFRLYEPITNKAIFPHLTLDFWSRDHGETAYNYIEFNFSITGYEEVEIFFFYRDRSAGNDNHKIWMTNFQHEIPIHYDYTKPIITSEEKVIFDENEQIKQIYWTIEDSNPVGYEIYKDGTLEHANVWTHNTTVVHNLGELITGIYNFTLKAFDTNNNWESKTIVVVILAVEETPFQLMVAAITLVSVCYYNYRKRRK